MRTIDFNGVTVEYDERCIMSYRWQKAITSGDTDRSIKAFARLLGGKDEYYAYAIGTNDPMSYEEWLEAGDDLLDDSMGVMADLMAAIVEDMGQTAKN